MDGEKLKKRLIIKNIQNKIYNNQNIKDQIWYH
jgi:hypothetical protein